MKTGKLIIYNSVSFIASLLVIMTYILYGFPSAERTWDYFSQLILPFITLFILWFSSLFTNLSYVVSKVLHRKNLLRVSVILLLLLTITSIIKRILEMIDGIFCIICIILTIAYIILLSLNISILNDLYKLVRELFLNQK